MKKRLKNEKSFYITMTLLTALIIFLFSTISTSVGEHTGLNPATAYHLGVFFMFTFFLTLSIKGKRLDAKTISIIFLISLAYAISDEFHQLFVPGRFATWKDVLVDMIGSACAVIGVRFLESIKKI